MAETGWPDNTVAKRGAVDAFWRKFCAPFGVDPDTADRAWYFGDSAALAHPLAELMIHGPKRAAAGLAWPFEPIPQAAPAPDG